MHALYLLAFGLTAFLSMVVVPYAQARWEEDLEDQRRAEHFRLTEQYRTSIREPVFEGLDLMGNDLDQT